MLYDGGDVVFLEETDGGDAGGSGFEARARIGEGDSAESQDSDVRLAGPLQHREASGVRGAGVLFFEDGSEDGKGCAVGGGLGYFC